ncbi:putative bifunctional diguanylate cyclase/phosphodiesterase [Sphingomonas radiodurans]|uniref:putative bifunctional diguanylate cyclase/phosphodiesterase n=1 Tax=Sphingomonas radiodurans TaxID=2890321 RepID=UPI001E4AEC19|nr:GGDEF domain-containing phosphodiesterase [Sphingomonas radiodurans]WBH16373.1 GGDEF domain-containing phosphodiesterase [Sphingomonas radiodurans]
MGNQEHDRGQVVLGAGADAFAPLVVAAGWSIGGGAAEIRLVDARDGVSGVSREDASAVTNHAALLAIVRDADGAARAYDAGATHVLVEPIDAASLTLALRFAGRHARRLHSKARARRAGEAGEGAVQRFLAARGSDTASTVAMIAMTRFDTVNAAFGRDAGDLLLNEAGARIAAALPPAAVIERDEGAQFVIAIDECGEAASARIALIEAALARRFTLDASEASLGVRIGVAHRAPGEAWEALVGRAKEALDHALTSDGASVRVAPLTHAAHGIRLAADLHRAIERDEIDILFQPQVVLADGAIVGVEALARWEHPEHGVLGAETLFAAAERAGLGLALSEHIQALAMTMASRWTAPLAGLRVAINVTAADLARSDFVDSFLAIVRRSTIDPGRVTVEVTESGFVTDLAEASARLERLREVGLRVAIDDFGTGYSSLAYLKALPLDYLKIDRSLTQDIAGGHRGRVVVRGIIAIANGLGLTTIAEGVEDDEQHDLLAAEGCDLYQGFLCAGPLDEVALAALIGRAEA